MAEALLKVDGMTCNGCVQSVTRALKRVPGVQDVSVLLAEGSARVTYDPGAVQPQQLVGAVEKAGYDASVVAPAS